MLNIFIKKKKRSKNRLIKVKLCSWGKDGMDELDEKILGLLCLLYTSRCV